MRLRAAWTVSGREIGDRKWAVEVEMGKVVPAEPVGQPLQAGPRIGQLVQFLRDPLRFRLGRADGRAEPGQYQDLLRRAPFRRGRGLDLAVEIERRRLLQMRGEDRLGMARREAHAGGG